jgi:putative membrane protein
MRNKRFIILALATFGMVACTNSGPIERAEGEQTREEGALEGTRLKTDAQFIKIYVQQTLFSMAAAKIADDRAINPRVRDFADDLQDDYRRLYEEAVKLAENNKLPVPDEITEEQAEELEDLRNADELAFDEIYLETVVNYTQAVNAEADNLIKNSQLDPIIDFATKMKESQFVHFNRAQELRQELGT